jgi:hypothetical protein
MVIYIYIYIIGVGKLCFAVFIGNTYTNRILNFRDVC